MGGLVPAAPLVAADRDPVEVVTPAVRGVISGTLSPTLTFLMVNASSLTNLGFSSLLGSKCWVVTPSVPDKSTLENLFHIRRTLFTMKLLLLRDCPNSTSLTESPKQWGPQDTLIFCCRSG